MRPRIKLLQQAPDSADDVIITTSHLAQLRVSRCRCLLQTINVIYSCNEVIILLRSI